MNLIITDYCMPGMTGYDLLTRVKVNPTTETPRNVYFVFVIGLILYSSIVCCNVIVFRYELNSQMNTKVISRDLWLCFCRNLRGKTFRSWSCLRKTCLRESTGEQQTPIFQAYEL